MPGGFKAQPVPSFIRKRKEQAKQSLRVLSTSIAKPDKKEKFAIGDTVSFVLSGKKRTGLLVFIGTTHFSDGEWCGLVLDEAIGKNDGSVLGVRYFDCKEKHGLFLPVDKVKLVSKGSQETDEIVKIKAESNSKSQSESPESAAEEVSHLVSVDPACSKDGKSSSSEEEIPPSTDEDMKTVVTKEINLSVANRPMTIKIGEGVRVNDDDGRSGHEEQKSMVVFITGQRRAPALLRGSSIPLPSHERVTGPKVAARRSSYDHVKEVAKVMPLERSRSDIALCSPVQEDERGSDAEGTNHESYDESAKDEEDLNKPDENEWPGQGTVKQRLELFNSRDSGSDAPRNLRLFSSRSNFRDSLKYRSRSFDSIVSSKSNEDADSRCVSSASMSSLSAKDLHENETIPTSPGRRRSLPAAKRKIASARLRRDSVKSSSLDSESISPLDVGSMEEFPELSMELNMERASSDPQLGTLDEDTSASLDSSQWLSQDDIRDIEGNTVCPRTSGNTCTEDKVVTEATENHADIDAGAELRARRSLIPKKTGIPKTAVRGTPSSAGTGVNFRPKKQSVSGTVEKVEKKETLKKVDKKETEKKMDRKETEKKMNKKETEKKTDKKETEKRTDKKEADRKEAKKEIRKEMVKQESKYQEQDMNVSSQEETPAIPRVHRMSVGDMIAKIEKTKPRKTTISTTKPGQRRGLEKGPNEVAMGNKQGSPLSKSSQCQEELAAKEYLSQKFVEKQTSVKYPVSASSSQNGTALGAKQKNKTRESKTAKVAPVVKGSPSRTSKLNRSVSVASDASSYVSITETEKPRESELSRAHENLRNQVNFLRNSLSTKNLTLEALAVVIQHYSEMVETASIQNVSLNRQCGTLSEVVSDKDREIVEIARQVESLQDKLQSSQYRHAKDLEDLRLSLKAQHERHIDEVSTEYHDELEHLKELHADEVNRINTSCQDKLTRETDELIEQHNKDMETVVSDYEEKLEELKVQIIALHSERDSLKRQIEEMGMKRESRSPYPVSEYDLPAELESLEAVLEIKKDEIKELRQQNMEMKKKMEDYYELQREHEKIVHEKEALIIALENKTKFQRQISVERDNLAANLEQESRKVMRLSMEKEELLWKVSETSLSTSTPSLNNNFSPTKLGGSPRSPTSPMPKKYKRLSLNLPTVHDEYSF